MSKEIATKGTLLWLVCMLGSLGCYLVYEGEYGWGALLLILAIAAALCRELLKPILLAWRLRPPPPPHHQNSSPSLSATY